MENIKQICKDECSGKRFIMRFDEIEEQIIFCCENGFAVAYKESFNKDWWEEKAKILKNKRT